MPTMLHRSSVAALILLGALAGCDGLSQKPSAPSPAGAGSSALASNASPQGASAPAPQAAAASAPPVYPSGSTQAPSSPPSPAALDDAAFGALVAAVSEPEGKFPSDNYVSNETSYLHVTKALDRPSLAGGVYIGVGPEQSFTYLAQLKPRLAFVTDIRRENLVLHLLYKVAFERSGTRAAFLCSLLSRAGGQGEAPASDAPIKDILAWVEARPKADEAEVVKAVEQRAGALGVPLDASDRKHLAAAVRAFARDGLGIHYTMEGSARRYPTLGELLSATDDEGKPRGFLGTDEAYQAVRALERENRVVPMVGDLAGDVAMPRLAAELKRRGEKVTVFYASNVEQYLFSPGVWSKWLRNLGSMPRTDDAVLVRVYFDQGKPHPAQRKGHRTTSLTIPVSTFLERASGKGYKSWWDVATDENNR